MSTEKMTGAASTSAGRHIEGTAVTRIPNLPTWTLLGGLIVIDVALQPGLLSLVQVGYFVQGALTIILVAAAQTFAIMVRGLDLSVAGTMALGNVLAASWLGSAGIGHIWSVPGILLIGAAIGGFNGLLISYASIQPVMATLASWTAVGGFALLVMPVPGGVVPPGFTALFTTELLGIPVSFLWLGGLILLWRLLYRSRLGLQLRAVGGDDRRAALNGVPVRNIVLMAYTLSGLLAAAAGLYLAATTSGGDATIGYAYLLPSIAAVVVGGTALSGGKGGIGLTVAGAFALSVLADIITALAFAPNVAIVASSALLLVVVGMRQFAERRKGHRSWQT